MSRYRLEDEQVNDLIATLIEMQGGSPDSDLLQEIITTALKLANSGCRLAPFQLLP